MSRCEALSLVLWFISMATSSPGEPNTARPSRRPYGPPQGERICKRIYEMLHLVKVRLLAQGVDHTLELGAAEPIEIGSNVAQAEYAQLELFR